MIVAGALWREERTQDRLARLERLLTSSEVTMFDLLGGRQLGESRVPGYRAEDWGG